MSYIDDVVNAAVQYQDQSETVTSTEFAPPEAGPTVARFIEYIELGKQKQKPFQGKPKPDALEVRLVFELLHPKKNIKEIEFEDGTKKTVADRISITTAVKLSDRASFKKLFNKMTYGRENIKHMAQMLNEPFVVTVVHNKNKEGDKVYANLRDAAGEWKINPPFVTDPISGKIRKYPVPEALSHLKVFIWNNPTEDTWNSLFIDGTRTVTKDGKETEVSKNWIQEKIQKATDFKGSKLQDIILKLGNLSTEPQDEDIDLEEDADLDDDIPFDGSADIALQALNEMNGETAEDDDMASLGLT